MNQQSLVLAAYTVEQAKYVSCHEVIITQMPFILIKNVAKNVLCSDDLGRIMHSYPKGAREEWNKQTKEEEERRGRMK